MAVITYYVGVIFKVKLVQYLTPSSANLKATLMMSNSHRFLCLKVSVLVTLRNQFPECTIIVVFVASLFVTLHFRFLCTRILCSASCIQCDSDRPSQCLMTLTSNIFFPSPFSNHFLVFKISVATVLCRLQYIQLEAGRKLKELQTPLSCVMQFFVRWANKYVFCEEVTPGVKQIFLYIRNNDSRQKDVLCNEDTRHSCTYLSFKPALP